MQQSTERQIYTFYKLSNISEDETRKSMDVLGLTLDDLKHLPESKPDLPSHNKTAVNLYLIQRQQTPAPCVNCREQEILHLEELEQLYTDMIHVFEEIHFSLKLSTNPRPECRYHIHALMSFVEAHRLMQMLEKKRVSTAKTALNQPLI